MLNSTVKSVIRRFGVKITWQHAGGAGVDLDTGSKSDSVLEQVIRTSMILQEAITEKFTYDLSYIAANSNFIQGGFYSQGKRTIVVLKIDLPSYTHQDRVKIGTDVYRIHKSFDNPNGAWGFNLTDIKNVSS